MAIDGLMLYSISKQLNTLCPCKINKIQNISDEEILFNLHTRDQGNQRCVINVHSNTNRIYLSGYMETTQSSPSNFVMVLRKCIGNGILESIEQKNFDRILCMHITHRNELGDLNNYDLYIELMGKYANMILVCDQQIVDALKRIPVYENTKRFIHPGALYVLPEQKEKKNPLVANDIDTDTSLVSQFYGFSPLLSREFLYRMHKGQTYSEILNELLQSQTMYLYEKEFHCIELTHLHQTPRVVSFMEGLNQIHQKDESKNRIREQCTDVFRTIENEKRKALKKLPKLEASFEKAKEYGIYQEYGDLLFAYMYNTEKAPVITLPSFTDGKDINIPIDMRYDLKTNANKFYQKYHKLKRSQSILLEQIEQCKKDIEYYTQLSEQLNYCSIDDAREIREELIQNHVLRSHKKHRRQTKKHPNYLHLKCEGFEIYIGKNNLQNNYITHRLSRKQDIWFHVKGYHGSHVLLKTEHPDERQIRMCAQLAAYHSKGKHSSSVPVDYCPISQIKKVPGSKIGFVTMKSYKTIYIDPEESVIQEWIKTYKR